DGGPTDIDNAALLCRAHHTVVHRERYAGRVLRGPRGPYVRWDLTTGSYDTRLASVRGPNVPTGPNLPTEPGPPTKPSVASGPNLPTGPEQRAGADQPDPSRP